MIPRLRKITFRTSSKLIQFPGLRGKRSYIEVANINALLPAGTPEALYIFGSGTYPGDDACATSAGDGDNAGDGCAIAGAEIYARKRLT